MAATRSARRRRVRLAEDIVRSAPGKLRVDRDAGIIHGVKVLGFESVNGRRYLPEAVQKAAPLYEGRSVRVNHPKRPADSRDSEDVFGKLRQVHLQDDGLYADLHYLKSHPMADRVCEAAERMPDVFGLSHNAQGDGETRNGVFVVTEIVEVRSVDLVADPATTNGLFEGKGHRVAIKLKAFLEAIKLGGKISKLWRKERKRLLLEDGPMDGDMDMPDDTAAPGDDAEPQDHVQALRQGFEGSCMSVIQQALDGSMDPKDALKKLKDLINTHCKLTAGESGAGSGGEDVEEEDDEEDMEEGEGCDTDEKDGKMKESVELKFLRREKKARQLCEDAGVAADTVLLEAMARLDDRGMKKLLEREKERSKDPPAPKPKPRSGSSGGKKSLTESADARGEGIDDFMAACRR